MMRLWHRAWTRMPAVIVQLAEDGSQPKGMVDLLALPLYSFDVKQHEWPWVFEKGNPPALAILTLEAFAVFAALWAYRGEVSRPHGSRVFVVATWTDKRGNGAN